MQNNKKIKKSAEVPTVGTDNNLEVKGLNNKDFKSEGDCNNPALIPAIIQDYQSGEVLMLAYMSSQSFKKSMQTGTTWFWSRSRKELWNKGSTSGNKQIIKEIRYDCDNDALLLKVEQKGFACHTGKRSCFFNVIGDKDIKNKKDKSTELINATLKFVDFKNPASEILKELYEVIIERLKQKNEKSYTYSLHKMGIDEILKKLGEESIEIILSAKHQSKNRTISEISDLMYHLLVLMAEKKIRLEDIYTELKSRRK